MMPWSMGCSSDVQLAGKNIRVMLPRSMCGWLGALSINKRMCRSCFFIDLLRSRSHSSNRREFIHVFLLNFQIAGNCAGSLCLKHRGLQLFPMMSGFSFSVPDMFAQRRTVNRSFGILHPWQVFPFVTNDLLGKALLKKVLSRHSWRCCRRWTDQWVTPVYASMLWLRCCPRWHFLH